MMTDATTQGSSPAASAPPAAGASSSAAAAAASSPSSPAGPTANVASGSSPAQPPKASAPAVAADQEADEPAGPIEAPESSEGIIDMDVFSQIRDMDDEEDEDDRGEDSFSHGIVWGYFEQAEDTFNNMKAALERKDLAELSGLGHFLKGSSAALGIIRVQASCEKMQHYGACRDEEAGESLEADEALSRIATLLKICRKDYEVAKALLVKLYEEE